MGAEIETLVQALEMLQARLDALEERLAKNESVLMDELIGGLTKLYQGNMRMQGVKGLRERHGGLFEKVLGPYTELYPEDDLFEKVYDLLEGAKGADSEWNDEKEMDSLKKLATAMMDKFKKIAPKAEEVAVQVELSPEEELGKLVEARKKRVNE